ncbi:hypothetical protein GCK32_002191 [Trichostrongylus colubriformis]|uniref:Uncharacterized protein n=1 Tax=Trichostrongylus colubriformis TaxID=6319 RepID=A0AAN8G937_TRICO
MQMSLAWLIDNISILPSLIPRSGSYLEHLLGKEYVFVKDALMANPHDRLTFHSLANVIRNILKERPEA